MDRDDVLSRLREAGDTADLDVAGKAARDWLAEHPDDTEIMGALEEATARVEPRTGRM